MNLSIPADLVPPMTPILPLPVIALDGLVRSDLGCQHAGEIGAFLFLEQDGDDVGALLDLVQDAEGRVRVILGDIDHRLAMRIFKVKDETEIGIRRSAQNVRGLCHDILGFDRLAFNAGGLQGALETFKREIVVGLVSQTALRDNERCGLYISGVCRGRPKGRGEDRCGHQGQASECHVVAPYLFFRSPARLHG